MMDESKASIEAGIEKFEREDWDSDIARRGNIYDAVDDEIAGSNHSMPGSIGFGHDSASIVLQLRLGWSKQRASEYVDARDAHHLATCKRCNRELREKA
jgi:hypothetical protein